MLPFDIGYQLSLEQFQPDSALEQVMRSEKEGFQSIWASDHFHPWFHTNASSVFAWTFLASAAQATQKVRLGTAATCPILRYHPALIAQAFATLNYMYGDRIFLSLATGEPFNELPLGYEWPSHSVRIQMLEEAITLIRKLWGGEFVSFTGNFYKLKGAKLYTPPKSSVPIFIAGSGKKACELAGRIGDGLLTSSPSEESLNSVIFPALRKGLTESGREFDTFNKSVEIGMSYSQDYEKALESVRPWGGTMLPIFRKALVTDPREIEACGTLVGDKQLSSSWIIATSSEPFIKAIERFKQLGFNNVHVTSSSPDQCEFIRLFGKEVIPYFQ